MMVLDEAMTWWRLISMASMMARMPASMPPPRLNGIVGYQLRTLSFGESSRR
jgi:hypothetical protein